MMTMFLSGVEIMELPNQRVVDRVDRRRVMPVVLLGMGMGMEVLNRLVNQGGLWRRTGTISSESYWLRMGGKGGMDCVVDARVIQNKFATSSPSQ